MKKSKQKSKKKTKAKKKRIDYICDEVKNLSKEGASLEGIAKRANQKYVKNGGDDNKKQTHHHLRVVLPVLINFELVTEKDGKFYPGK